MPKQTSRKLLTAQKARDDEFYTPREMITAELQHYDPERIFKGKKILCNCDDPERSQFFQYFADNFTAWGIERLVGIRFAGSSLSFEPVQPLLRGKKETAQEARDKWKARKFVLPLPCKRTLSRDKNGNLHGTPPVDLKAGDTGGFEGREGLRQLRECDIVVTNPPFSRFREFVTLLMAYKKKFIIIGNVNAVGYKEIFPLIQSGNMWLGTGRCQGEFIRPDGKVGATAPACWYTNMHHNERERELITLTAKYDAKTYPSYDNYPAIEVGHVGDIPANYDGEMGVPRTFLEKHNPKQFEIVGKMRFPSPSCERVPDLILNGKLTPDRILIRRAGANADWVETQELDRLAIGGSAAGFVYVLTNPDYPRNHYKIGKAKNVARRIEQHNGSAVLKPYRAVMSLRVNDDAQAERTALNALADYRVKGKREVFNIPRRELERVLSKLAGKKLRLWR